MTRQSNRHFKSLFKLCLIGLVLTLLGFTRFAYAIDTWSWFTLSPTGSGSGYLTKEAAVQAMQDSCPTCGILTKQSIGKMGGTSISFGYTGSVNPDVGPWEYYSDGSVGRYNTEQEVYDWWLSRFTQYPECPAPEWYRVGGWETVTEIIPGKPSAQGGRTNRFAWGLNIYTGECHKTHIWTPETQGYTIERVRSVTCPTPSYFNSVEGTCSLFPGTVTGPLERCEGTVGNPCSAATGDKTQRKSDYQSTSLSFTRQYHSRASEPYSRNGVGWIHNYARRLAFNGATSPGGLITENGYHKPLRYDSSTQTYYADVGAGFSLQKQGTEWHLTRSSKNIEVYSKDDGRLLRTERDGQTTQLLYNSDGSLQQVVGPFNHTLTFSYVNGLLDNVTDPEGNQYKYRYNGIGNLTKVIYPGGLSRLYHYEDIDFPYHLTGITDENGDRFATFAYDDEGRAILTEHAQTDNGAPQEQFQLDYGQ